MSMSNIVNNKIEFFTDSILSLKQGIDDGHS